MIKIDVSEGIYRDALNWVIQAESSQDPEMMGDMMAIQNIVDLKPSDTRYPFKILDYFGVRYDPVVIGGRVWEVVGDISHQLFTQMLALTGDEYRLDQSRETGHFILWYRSRSPGKNAMSDLGFAREHSIETISNSEIRDSSVHGLGLFSAKGYPANFMICELDGSWIDFDDYERISSRIAPGIGRFKDYFFMEWNYHHGKILARYIRTSYGFINHSTSPNLEIRNTGTIGRPALSVHTIQPIKPNEELFLDYRKEDLPRGYLKNPSRQYLHDAIQSMIRKLGSTENGMSLIDDSVVARQGITPTVRPGDEIPMRGIRSVFTDDLKIEY